MSRRRKESALRGRFGRDPLLAPHEYDRAKAVRYPPDATDRAEVALRALALWEPGSFERIAKAFADMESARSGLREALGDCAQARTVAGPASPGAKSSFVSAIRGPSTIAGDEA